jgi:sec-independent protein translocase protein TatC
MAADDVSMTFWEHLEELRRRIIISAIVIGVFAVVSLSLRVPIMKVLRRPIETPLNMQLVTLIDRTVGSEGSAMGFLSIALNATASSRKVKLNNPGAIEGIMAWLRISITCGVLLASPLVLYQVWAFIFPALTHREKRFALPLFLIIVVFFVAGAVFAYFIVAPVVIEFSAKLYSDADFENLWSIDRYVSFLPRLLLGFGIAFELPVAMAFLARIGVINSQGFRERQSYAVVGIFMMSALLTPADVMSMLLMAIPLILLYQLGIFLAFLVEQEPESYA